MVVIGYNFLLVLGAARLWWVAKKAIQHAPGRFHSGAQVVKETEQAAKHHAKVASRLQVRESLPVSAAGFRINITGNPHD